MMIGSMIMEVSPNGPEIKGRIKTKVHTEAIHVQHPITGLSK